MRRLLSVSSLVRVQWQLARPSAMFSKLRTICKNHPNNSNKRNDPFFLSVSQLWNWMAKRSRIWLKWSAYYLSGCFYSMLYWVFSLEKAKEFHEVLEQLHGAIYELTERFERQKYDVSERPFLRYLTAISLLQMVELSERARQIEKGFAHDLRLLIPH